MNDTPRLWPSLWFDTQTEEAVKFYLSVFNGSPHRRRESRILSITRYEKDMNVPGADRMEGRVLTAVFELDGQKFMALDGGPMFKFNEAVSICIECDDQAEVDYFWVKLSAVPQAEACGWLKDRYGLSWQVIPKGMGEILGSPDRKKALAAINSVMTMKKLIIADIRRAFDEG